MGTGATGGHGSGRAQQPRAAARKVAVPPRASQGWSSAGSGRRGRAGQSDGGAGLRRGGRGSETLAAPDSGVQGHSRHRGARASAGLCPPRPRRTARGAAPASAKRCGATGRTPPCPRGAGRGRGRLCGGRRGRRGGGRGHARGSPRAAHGPGGACGKRRGQGSPARPRGSLHVGGPAAAAPRRSHPARQPPRGGSSDTHPRYPSPSETAPRKRVQQEPSDPCPPSPQAAHSPLTLHPALFEVKHFGVGQHTGAQHHTAPAPCPPHPHPSPYNRRELLLHPHGRYLPHHRKGRGGATTQLSPQGEGQPPTTSCLTGRVGLS